MIVVENLDEQEICRLYRAKVGTPTLERRTGRSQCYIDGVLKRHGVKKRGVGRLPDIPRPERRVPKELADRALALYRAGNSGKEIARRLPISRPTALKIAREAGEKIRLQASNLADVESRIVEIGSLRGAARDLGVGRKAIVSHLRRVGIKVNAKGVAKRYQHDSPIAGAITVRGTWELKYAQILDALVDRGFIGAWSYERTKIRLSDGSAYIPDFLVTANDGTSAFHEVKGKLWGRSMEKIRLARDGGASVVLVRRPLIDAMAVSLHLAPTPFRS